MNNLPIKAKIGLIGKIGTFFRKIFYKPEYIENTKEIKDTNYSFNSNNREEFKDKIVTEINNEYLRKIKRDTYIKQIEEDPDLLYNLPLEKIERIGEYYKELVKKEEEENQKLNKELAKLNKVS